MTTLLQKELRSYFESYIHSKTVSCTLLVHLLIGCSVAIGVLLSKWVVFARVATYSDFVVGPSTFAAGNPSKTVLTALLFLFVGFATTLALQCITFLLELRSGGEVVEALSDVFWWCCIPEAFFLGLHLVRGDVGQDYFKFAASFKAFLFIGMFPLVRFGAALKDKEGRNLLSQFLMAVMLAIVPALSLVLMLSRFAPATATDKLTTALVNFSLFATVLAALALIALAPKPGVAGRRMNYLLLGLQLPAPVLMLTLVPANWLLDGKSHPGLTAKWPLWMLAVVYGTLAMIQLFRQVKTLSRKPMDRLRKSDKATGGVNKPEFALKDGLVVLCLGAILVFANVQPFFGPQSVNPDDYHVGEEITPYQQYKLFGSVPYGDLNSPRGLRPFIAGFVNEHLYGGLLDSRTDAEQFVQAIGILCLFLTARLVLGIPFAFLFTYVFSPHYGQLLYVTSGFFLLAFLAARKRLGDLLPYWLLTILFLVPFNLPTGGPFAIASICGLAVAYWVGANNDPPAKSLQPGIVKYLPTGIGILILCLFYRMYFGLARFLYETVSTNTIANAMEPEFGTALSGKGLLSSPLAFELTRFFLIISVLAAVGGFVWAYRSHLTDPARTRLLFLSVTIFCFLILVTPYSMGRIQGNDLSRPGMFSLWLLGAIVPACLSVSGNIRRAPQYFLLLLLVGAAWAAGFPDYPANLDRLKLKANYLIPISQKDLDAAAPEFGLGMSRLEPEHRKQLSDLRKTLIEYLKPGETYLDLTNHSARYYYLGYRAPVLEGAFYNAAAPATQKRMVRQLVENPPPVVLIDASNIYFDGGKAPLRGNLLYRYIVRKYVPVQEGPFTLMVDTSRMKQAVGAGAGMSSGAVSPCKLTDRFWKNGISTISGRAGFTDCDGSKVFSIRRGDSIVFAGSGKRIVENIVGDQVWVSGAMLKPEEDGFPHEILVESLPSDSNVVVACNLTDPNWRNGISLISQRAGFTDCDGKSVADLKPGDTVILPASGPRKVESIAKDQVWLSGAPLDPERDGFPHPIKLGGQPLVPVDPTQAQRMLLLEKAFFTSDLEQLPAAWGLSSKYLEKHLRRSATMDRIPWDQLVGCKRKSDGSFEPEADTVSFSVDVRGLKLSGESASMMKVELKGACAEGSAPVLQLFWRSDLTFGRDAPHVKFSAPAGVFLVPLDTNPRLFLSKSISKLRFELHDAKRYKQFEVKGISFYSRED